MPAELAAPSEQSAGSSLVTGDCPGCRQRNRGAYDPFFNQVEFRCGSCHRAWVRRLTDEERWDVIHDRAQRRISRP